MSTFGTLLMLLFLIIFGIQITLYCFNKNKPYLSNFLTLLLIVMLLSELVLTFFEIPAKLIDIIVYISMGYKIIAVGCGIVLSIILVFIFVMLYPKIPWGKVLSANLVKYVIIGAAVIGFMTYTEVFNGSYSFDSLDEYNSFKASFSQYDNRFWPTKYIKDYTELNGGYVDTYSVYPWDVKLPSGKQFVYKIITFYDTDENDGLYKFYYFPFTYKLYAGSTPQLVDKSLSDTANNQNTSPVSSSDQD